MNTSPHYDIAIVGAGLVGASVAIALASAGKKVLLLESGNLELNQTIDEDARNTVLGFGSRELLENIGVWGVLQDDFSQIDTVHVSQKGSFGVTRLTKETEGLPALGYLIPNHKILTALYAKLRNCVGVDVSENVSALNIVNNSQSVQLSYQHKDAEVTAMCKLLIGADGTRSGVREQLGIEADITDYEQSALVANVKSSSFETGLAYERFTKQGPVALLPLANKKYSMIWVASPEEVQTLLNLPEKEFLARLQKHFGFRIGLFESCGQRQVYPLRLLRAQQVFHNRCLLIGNAAYTVHPIAGQGFNLALRDINYLSALLGQEDDPGLDVVLEQYERERREDVDRIIRFTDGLLRLFSSQSRFLKHARGAALMILGQSPLLQRQVSRQGLGLFRNNVSALASRSESRE